MAGFQVSTEDAENPFEPPVGKRHGNEARRQLRAGQL
jgi:hypothetical protein